MKGIINFLFYFLRFALISQLVASVFFINPRVASAATGPSIKLSLGVSSGVALLASAGLLLLSKVTKKRTKSKKKTRRRR